MFFKSTHSLVSDDISVSRYSHAEFNSSALLSGQLPFMLEKDIKNEIWRPLYHCWTARRRHGGRGGPVKYSASICWRDSNHAFIWVLIHWPFSLWKRHFFFVICFSELLKRKLSYNSDGFLQHVWADFALFFFSYFCLFFSLFHLVHSFTCPFSLLFCMCQVM